MIAEKQSVNYIKHLTDAIHKISDDNRLSPSHFSMYLVLFHQWNKNRFKNSFLIIRSDIMTSSKVKSKSTYHRCIRDLQNYGYIQYFPSKNASTGSKIIITTFDDEKGCKSVKKHSPKNELPTGHTDPINGHHTFENPKNGLPMEWHSPKNGLPIEPFNKHINNKKHINLYISQNEFCEPTKDEKNGNNFSLKNSSNRCVFIPPILKEIQEYFQEKNKPEIEAEKFFNYFEAKGWKIGDRSPMKNWRAAANNWIINYEKYNPPNHKSHFEKYNSNSDKDYHIPL